MHLRIVLTLLTVAVCVSSVSASDESMKLYGKITTVQGDVFEGFIRWDKNETTWLDILDGTKERVPAQTTGSRKRYRGARSERNPFFANNWSWDNYAAESGIRFGHVKTLTVIGDDRVELILKSGETIEYDAGSTDIGTDIRELLIEDKTEGEIELVWEDLDKVEFMAAPSSATSNSGERLYGTLTTRRGDTYSGFITWDMDEVLTKDVLDGEERGKTRKVPFSRITAIERYSSSGAEITLNGGDKIIMRGTNDVDESNQGIVVSDKALGDIRVAWDDFDKVEFKTTHPSFSYSDFTGGAPIQGTIHTEDGDNFSGEIKWDDDENKSWELLNGESRGTTFRIDFSNIASIERGGFRSVEVTLKDGRTLRLSDSNDVDDSNKGIFVTSKSGSVDEVDWDNFARMELTGK